MTGKPDAPPASPDSLATRAGCCRYPHAIQKEAEAQRRASARPGHEACVDWSQHPKPVSSSCCGFKVGIKFVRLSLI